MKLLLHRSSRREEALSRQVSQSKIACGCARAEVSLLISPSPRPSPAGRGRIARRVLQEPATGFARQSVEQPELSNRCPLSLRERVRVRVSATILTLAVIALTTLTVFAEQRFPPPDFTETNHLIPTTTTPPARAEWLQYLDVAVLFAGLGVAVSFVHRQRSRRGLFWLGIFEQIAQSSGFDSWKKHVVRSKTGQY